MSSVNRIRGVVNRARNQPFSGIAAPLIPPPTITSVDIDLGDPAGGDIRIVTGTHMSGTTGATVGGTAAACVSLSDTQVLLVTPAHFAAAGLDITVTTTQGTGTLAAVFEYWSPASLSLTGYWDRGNYQDVTAGTWPARTSGGSSGGRDLKQATASTQPVETNLEPDFDGADDFLGGGATTANGPSAAQLWTTTAGGIVALFRADTAAVKTDGWHDAGLIGDPSNYVVLYYTTSGIGLSLYDTGFKTKDVAADPGVLHLTMARWNGTTAGLRVDGGAEQPMAVSTLFALGTDAVDVGKSWASATTHYDGSIRTLLTFATEPTDADYTKLLKWARASRGLG